MRLSSGFGMDMKVTVIKYIFVAKYFCFVSLNQEKSYRGRKLQQGAEFSITKLPMNGLNNECSSYLYPAYFSFGE